MWSVLVSVSYIVSYIVVICILISSLHPTPRWCLPRCVPKLLQLSKGILESKKWCIANMNTVCWVEIYTVGFTTSTENKGTPQLMSLSHEDRQPACTCTDTVTHMHACTQPGRHLALAGLLTKRLEEKSANYSDKFSLGTQVKNHEKKTILHPQFSLMFSYVTIFSLGSGPWTKEATNSKPNLCPVLAHYVYPFWDNLK